MLCGVRGQEVEEKRGVRAASWFVLCLQINMFGKELFVIPLGSYVWLQLSHIGAEEEVLLVSCTGADSVFKGTLRTFLTKLMDRLAEIQFNKHVT